jgi:hypothetical protein
VSDNAQISNVSDNAQISNVYGNAQISNVYGNAAILFIDGSAKVQCHGRNIVSCYKSSEKKVSLDLSKHTTLVMLDELNTNFDSYQTFYPVEVKGESAIMYKAVHKQPDGIYTAHYDCSFTYEIGKKYTHECDPIESGSCSRGLHVSHKMWALKFGSGWDDMALLECEVPTGRILVSADCDGKVRTSELTVLREVPTSEYYI